MVRRGPATAAPIQQEIRLSNRILFVLLVCGLIAPSSAQSDFNRFTVNAGGGLGFGRHDVASYVGNSLHGVVGAGWNFNRMFGIDAEYMYYKLDFRPSVKNSQSLADQSGRMQSISLDGIINVPHHFGNLGIYGILGGGFYRRSVSVPSRSSTGWHVLSTCLEMVGH